MAEDGVGQASLADREVFVAVDIVSFSLQREANLLGACGAGRKNFSLEQCGFVGFAMAVMLHPVDP